MRAQEHVPICICLHGREEGIVRLTGGWIRPDAHGRNHVPEKSKGCVSYRDFPKRSPDFKRIVELLRRRKCREVPRVPAVVNVLDVAAHCNGLTLRYAAVDAPDAERVSYGLVVGEGFVGARLEGEDVAGERGVEEVVAGEDAVCVEAGAVGVCVDWVGC